jgi:transposase InsO family protein
MDTRYVGDITYVWTWSGFAYMATVIDLANRRVVGWAVADHMRTKLVEDALHMAFAQRRPARGVIFHSDRGSPVNIRARTSLLWPGQTASRCRSGPSGAHTTMQ